MTKLTRNKRFLLLWSSQISSQLAINIMNFLVLVQIYERTGSSIAASFIWVAYGIPAVVLVPVGAAAVDMLDKRKVLMTANITQALVILSYALLFKIYLYLSYGVVLLYSVMDQFYVPAEAATLPVIVPKKQLPRANGLFFISAQTSAILGFGMAGLIRELIGFSSTMMLGAVMLIGAFFAAAALPKVAQQKKHIWKSVDSLVFDFLENIKEGYEFIRKKATILYTFLFLIWLQVCLSVLVVNLPAIGTSIIRTKPSLAGSIVIGPAGLGALVGTLLVPRILARGIRKKELVDSALIILTIAFLLVGAVAPLLGFWTSRLVLILCFFFVGIAYVSALIPSVTFMQVQTPPNLMGRVFGNFWFIANTVTLLPILFSATITEIFGVHLMLLFIGVIAFSVFI